jgi:CheY-like chemotaxis protein
MLGNGAASAHQAKSASRRAGKREKFMAIRDSSSIRVLVIDDHQTMRKILRQLLGVVGIKDIMEAKHGEEALALVQDPQITDPDVILCDLHMDQMDGMEFCNKVRRTDAIRDRAIPILMLTGDDDPMLHEVSRQVGALKVLSKPIGADDLLAEIRSAIGFDAGTALGTSL